MVNKSTSAFDAATAVNLADLIAVVQAGADKKAALSLLKTAILNGLDAASILNAGGPAGSGPDAAATLAWLAGRVQVLESVPPPTIPTTALPLANVPNTILISGTLSSAQVQQLLRFAGTNLTVAMPTTLPTIGSIYYILNLDDTDLTLTSSSGFNRSGNNAVTIAKDELKMVIYNGAVSPRWSLDLESYVALAANQFQALNAAGTAMEARTHSNWSTLDVPDPASDGRFGRLRIQSAAKLESVQAATRGGTSSLQVKANGTAVTGFTSAVGLTTTNTVVTVGLVCAANDIITFHHTSVSGLTTDVDGHKGVDVSYLLTRLG